MHTHTLFQGQLSRELTTYIRSVTRYRRELTSYRRRVARYRRELTSYRGRVTSYRIVLPIRERARGRPQHSRRQEMYVLWPHHSRRQDMWYWYVL